MNTENDISSKFPAALLILLATLVGYLSAYFYHSEYLKVFGIPPELVSFDPSSLVVAAGNVLNFTFAFLTILIALAFVGGRPRNPVDVRFFRLVFVVIPAAFFSNLYPSLRNIVLIGVAFNLLKEFVWPLLKYPHVAGYMRKLQTADGQQQSIFEKIEPKFRVPVYLALVGLIIILLSSMAGRFNAVNTDKFLVMADQTDLIVPAVYTDKVIAVRVDKKLKKILPEIVVIAREPGKPLVLRWEKIGTLSAE